MKFQPVAIYRYREEEGEFYERLAYGGIPCEVVNDPCFKPGELSDTFEDALRQLREMARTLPEVLDEGESDKRRIQLRILIFRHNNAQSAYTLIARTDFKKQDLWNPVAG